jgi:putative heme-binding domain-containing protein
MYREVIEHPNSLPPIIEKHLDLTSGRDRGRIYRIVHEGYRQPPLPKLAGASTELLVALFQHPNGWHRDTAARLLYERQDTAAIAPLEKLATESALPLARLHALYALEGLSGQTEKVLLPRLSDDHAGVRRHAIRLAEKIAAHSEPIRDRLLAMRDDSNLLVRYQLAFSLGELPESPQRNKALVEIVCRDLSDGYIRLAVLSSLGQGAGEALALLAANPETLDSKEGRELVASLAGQIGRQQQPADIDHAMQVLAKLTQVNSPVLATIIQRLQPRAGSSLAEKIAAATGGRADALMKSLLADAARRAADDAVPLRVRIAAVEQLRLGKFADHQEVLASLLAPAVAAELQAATMTAMAAFDDAKVAELLLDRYSAFSPRLKSQATDVLLSRPPWTLALLKAIETGSISTGDIDPAKLKLLTEHRTAEIRNSAKKLLEGSAASRRADVVESYHSVLEMKGDATRGQQIFAKTCAACHKVQGVGQDIGPSLAAMKARGPEAILLNVLDPNREVNPQYLNYAVLTTDGRQLTGLIAAETATSLTLKRADNATDTVLRIDIEQLKSTGTSLMPEGIEKQIDQQAMADLLEYLRVAE